VRGDLQLLKRESEQLVNGKFAEMVEKHVEMVITQVLPETHYQTMMNAKTRTELMRYQHVVLLKEYKRD
jgi:hypothetical protein